MEEGSFGLTMMPIIELNTKVHTVDVS